MKKKSSNSIGVNRAFLTHPLSALRAYCLYLFVFKLRIELNKYIRVTNGSLL
jgi:hypothetical protein